MKNLITNDYPNLVCFKILLEIICYKLVKKNETSKIKRKLMLWLHNQCLLLRQTSKIVNRSHTTVKDQNLRSILL